MPRFVYPPAPGTTYGPCTGKCHHTDCARMRKIARSKCRICRKVVGYEALVMFEGDDQVVHAACAEAETRFDRETGRTLRR